jgi:hypothetical protein
MAIAHRPETFVALRARHEALRIAEAVIRGGGVNVEQLNCHSCGADLDWKRAIEQIAIDCPSCGAVNELPCHLRYRVPPADDDDAAGTLDYASVEPDRRRWWNDTLPTALAVASPVRAAAREPWPIWLKLFCLACLAAVLVSLALMALRARV